MAISGHLGILRGLLRERIGRGSGIAATDGIGATGLGFHRTVVLAPTSGPEGCGIFVIPLETSTFMAALLGRASDAIGDIPICRAPAPTAGPSLRSERKDLG